MTRAKLKRCRLCGKDLHFLSWVSVTQNWQKKRVCRECIQYVLEHFSRPQFLTFAAFVRLDREIEEKMFRRGLPAFMDRLRVEDENIRREMMLNAM